MTDRSTSGAGRGPDDTWRAVGFLRALRIDQRSGRVRSLAEYLAEFPGDDEQIAREYLHAVGSAESDPVAGGDVGAFGSYELLRELGRGGQGVVYAARDRRLDREVALKVLPAGSATDVEVLRLRREAMAASRLAHPGLCRVYEVGRADGRPYFSMELHTGGTLAQRLETWRAEGPPSIPYVLEVVEAIGRALQASHDAGIVHRDVKPANIAFADDGRPVLLDFGLARDASDGLPSLSRGAAGGTPAYMAPEQLDGTPGPTDERGDVWSLGVVLFEMLTLERPFDASTREGLCAAITTRPAPSPAARRAGLPADLVVVVKTALERDLALRYASAGRLADDLRRVREGEPIEARAPSRLRRASRWCGRNRALAAALGGVFLLMGAALALTVTFLGREADLRDVAEARADQIHGAARDLLLDLDAQLQDLPGATEARRRVLARAKEWLDELSAERRDDAALLADLARSYVRLGDVLGHPGTSNVGDAATAEQCYDRALVLAEEAVTRPGAVGRAARHSRAMALSRLGDLCLSTNRLDEAEERLTRAARHIDALPADEMDDRLSALRASTDIHRAQVAELRGDFGTALTRADEAIERMARVADRSERLDPALHLAGMRVVKCVLLQRVGRLEDAYALAHATASRLERIAEDAPVHELLWARVGSAWILAGECAAARSDRAACDEALERGIAWHRRRFEVDSGDVTAARQYALALVQRAEYGAEAEVASAEADLQCALGIVARIFELRPDHYMTRLLEARAEALLGTLECETGRRESGRGRLARAARAADALEAGDPDNRNIAGLAAWIRTMRDQAEHPDPR